MGKNKKYMNVEEVQEDSEEFFKEVFGEVLTTEQEVLQRERKIENLISIIDYYKEENKKLNAQIQRYEKLIDKI